MNAMHGRSRENTIIRFGCAMAGGTDAKVRLPMEGGEDRGYFGWCPPGNLMRAKSSAFSNRTIPRLSTSIRSPLTPSAS